MNKMADTVAKCKFKLSKGFSLLVHYSYGLPVYIWVKGRKSSNYPYVNEDVYCELQKRQLITEFEECKVYIENK